jgi:hypothetical protein
MARHAYSAEICERDHTGDVPQHVLDVLPKNQGHPVRHRCAACAYLAGLRDRETQIEPSTRDTFWACRLLLLTVAELHRRGYEQLRIAPYMSASAMHWRCRIVPKRVTRQGHGAVLANDVSDPLTYSSGSAFAFFNWGDCARCNPCELADRFVGAFRDLVADAHGADSEYAMWFRSMLTATEPLGIVYAFGEYEGATDTLYVAGECDVRAVALPPPGEVPS